MDPDVKACERFTVVCYSSGHDSVSARVFLLLLGTASGRKPANRIADETEPFRILSFFPYKRAATQTGSFRSHTPNRGFRFRKRT